MEKWKVFKDSKTGKEFCAYTIRGTFAGEEEDTKKLTAAINNIPQEQITVTIETR